MKRKHLERKKLLQNIHVGYKAFIRTTKKDTYGNPARESQDDKIYIQSTLN